MLTVTNDWLKFVRVPTISFPLETGIYTCVARLINLQTISYILEHNWREQKDETEPFPCGF